MAPRRHSRWSLSLGRVAGIDIRVHAAFLLLLVWVALNELRAGRGPAGVAVNLALIVCVFAIIVVHELAHALMARRFGVQTRDITLLPIGGVSSLERIPDKPRQELLIALAGPSVNIVLALLLFGLRALHVPLGEFGRELAWVNVGLALFNLLPAFPMDGGRILRAALALKLDYDRATTVAARLGQAVALIFGVLGLVGNPLLLLIALFVWVGAQQEATLVHVHSALKGVPVAQAMITRFVTLGAHDPLAKALQLGRTSFQTDFPVVEGDQLAGLVTREDVLAAVRRLGPEAPVARIMRRDVETVAADEAIESVLPRLSAADGHPLLVTDHGALVGLVTPASIADLLAANRDAASF